MKAHSLKMSNPSKDIGNAAISLWNTLITAQMHPQQSQTLAEQTNGNLQWTQTT
jgi:hypothetical protein